MLDEYEFVSSIIIILIHCYFYNRCQNLQATHLDLSINEYPAGLIGQLAIFSRYLFNSIFTILSMKSSFSVRLVEAG